MTYSLREVMHVCVRKLRVRSDLQNHEFFAVGIEMLYVSYMEDKVRNDSQTQGCCAAG